MPKYLYYGNYSDKGVSGLLQEGGSKRREAIKTAIESMGGTVESVYFAFGENDFYIIAEMPDNVSAAGCSLRVNASGAGSIKTTVLMTPEEVDQATQKGGDYRPPGQ